jgi:hypothetical protein
VFPYTDMCAYVLLLERHFHPADGPLDRPTRPWDVSALYKAGEDGLCT